MKTLRNLLLSEAIGDIAGSVYEFNPERSYGKIRLDSARADYTDDSVCTFAIAEALLHGENVGATLLKYCIAEPGRGYGGRFNQWIERRELKPYGSYGNGSAMRCSAAGFMARDEEECIRLATLTAECTHNHPEGIKGAVATALAIHYLLQGQNKAFVRDHVLDKYYPHFKCWSLDEIKPDYEFDETCQATVPICLIAFLESRSYSDCLKLSISLGGDADTIAAIAGPMAYAYYRELPEKLVTLAQAKLPAWMLKVNEELDDYVAAHGIVKDKQAHWTRALIFADKPHPSPKHPSYTPDFIKTLGENEVFVFGSNLAGAHGGGAARVAMNHFGAIWGQGVGMQGQSYAIPTMQGGVDTIKPYVDEFILFAKAHPEQTFYVTRIGCGIAGFRDQEIAPLFSAATNVDNIILPKTFADILEG